MAEMEYRMTLEDLKKVFPKKEDYEIEEIFREVSDLFDQVFEDFLNDFATRPEGED